MPDEISEIADLAGVLATYHDQNGGLVETSEDARRAVLSGLGFPVETPAERRDSLARLRARAQQLAPSFVIALAGAPTVVTLNNSSSADWTAISETGEHVDGRSSDGRLSIPALPVGYFRLIVRADFRETETLLLSAPARCWQPEELEKGQKGFGLTAQSYSLRSPRQFGVGDFTDIGDLAVGAARSGASFLGLSSAHALFPTEPDRHSPYSPSSRLFLQTLTIDPTDVGPGAAEIVANVLERNGLGSDLNALRAASLLDYTQVWRLKRQLFDALAGVLAETEADNFQNYRREHGEALEQHALFETLSEHFEQEGRLGSSRWPEAFRSAKSAQTREFAKDHAERVAFHARLQFAADRQFEKAQSRARSAGMAIGLYRDLAVGADRSGSELWSAPESYLTSMSIGAPPDPLGPQGQDWGLPPFDPIALAQNHLKPFRDLVVANMRHAGAIRIDHAFQLQRLFLIPVGAKARKGAYVSYPLEALLAVLRIESHRAGCLVIAEDLGTAPRGFSDAIMKAGIFSYRLLSFERDDKGDFLPPHAYPRDALASLGTHDLPTLRGWWRGLDADLRECFGFFDAAQAAQDRTSRARDRARLVTALRKEKLRADTDSVDASPPIESCLRFLSRAPSALAAVQIEDVIGETQQVNLPGPSCGHPNWRRRLTLDVAAITAPGGPLARAAAAMAMETRSLFPVPRRLSRRPPTATYRLQLRKEFGFAAATAIVPYLRALGISHVYSSPITRAAPGSAHGYDVVDYLEINPELGGMAGFLEFSEALRKNDLGLIVDFVPNHMGVAGSDNGWWMSVLELGRDSPFANCFDVDFDSPHSPGRVLLPILGESYAEALRNGALSVQLDAGAGAFFVCCHDTRLPLSPRDYPAILRRARDVSEKDGDVLGGLAMRFESSARARGDDLCKATAQNKADLALAVGKSRSTGEAIARALSHFDTRREDGRKAVDELISRQAYRPAFWRLASTELNYRRFFDISTLAGVTAERQSTFARMHELLFDLAQRDLIQGIRLDHVDGLADPTGYMEKLQAALGPGFYIVVEKILEAGEDLRDWPVAGATGYEALAEIDQLFVDSASEPFFESLTTEAAGAEFDYAGELWSIKADLLQRAFGAELSKLVHELTHHAARAPLCLDLGASEIRDALSALLVAFPVYRSYIDANGPSAQDLELFARARASALQHAPAGARAALDFVVETLTAAAPDDAVWDAVVRFQQLTGPLMAKSVEDTLFYRYPRLIALNEVGGDPSRFGLEIDDFHASMQRRMARWSSALTATATHDAKRGEDSRARLIAMTSRPEAWNEALRVFRTAASRAPEVPDAPDSYFLFQTILGAAPPELIEDPRRSSARKAFAERIRAFSLKAMREAKRRTSWTEPDEAYEKATLSFVTYLLETDERFLTELAPHASRAHDAGCRMSLARSVLKCTLPGVPDFYQGTEFWDFSLVDPDNRRPVDYRAREKRLATYSKTMDAAPKWTDDGLKQSIVARLLADRQAAPDLYAFGLYTPVPVRGAGAGRFLVFERVLGDDRLLVLSRLRFDDAADADGAAEVVLSPRLWRNLIDGATLQTGGPVSLERLLGPWPALVLRTFP